MPSDTIIYQSFRTQNVPPWITRCMQTTRDWATLRGYDYHFIDDKLFDFIPPDLRARTQNKVILSDLARLLVAKDLLQHGHHRAVWIDADVVVFNPEAWHLPTAETYYFCHELWPTPLPNGVRFDLRVNNAICIFSQGNPFLDFYIDSCQRILESNQAPIQWTLGTRFLKAMLAAYPVPLLKNIGMLDPNMLEDIAQNSTHLLPTYIKAMNQPLVAANCCLSATNTTTHGLTLTDEVFNKIIDRCIATRGKVMNQYLRI